MDIFSDFYLLSIWPNMVQFMRKLTSKSKFSGFPDLTRDMDEPGDATIPALREGMYRSLKNRFVTRRAPVVYGGIRWNAPVTPGDPGSLVVGPGVGIVLGPTDDHRPVRTEGYVIRLAG